MMFIHLACKKLINTYFFECAISIVIVANSALIGVESQLATHGESVEWADLAEIGFMGTYILELIVRAIALRWSALRDGWFLFDFGLVMIAILEQVLSVAVAGSAGQQIMILRLLRLFRLVRTFRMIKQIRSIWRLVYGLMNSSETMVAAFALLGLVLYVFGVLALQ
ncbi:NaCP60E, partial [Symbiodinium sp. CCMP2456]